jgi:hypothetical protein
VLGITGAVGDPALVAKPLGGKLLVCDLDRIFVARLKPPVLLLRERGGKSLGRRIELREMRNAPGDPTSLAGADQPHKQSL